MLPRAHRLTSGAEISSVIRHGRRYRIPYGTVHMWITSEPDAVRAAFVVGKPVGNSVARSTVARRLRHGFAPLISLTPPGSCVVVRVFEGSHALSSTEWTEHLRTAITAMSAVLMPATPPVGIQDGDAS